MNLFEKLLVKEGQVASLLAQAYIGMSKSSLFETILSANDQFPLDEEVKAVQALHRAMHNYPQSYSLLHVQCDFLRSKV